MYEVYEELRRQRGVRDTEVAKATGIPQSTFSDWKKGKSKPKMEKLEKIADFFGVTVRYLMTGQEKEEQYYQDIQTALLAQRMREDENLRILFDAAKDASPEDLKTVSDMLLLLKKRGKLEPED